MIDDKVKINSSNLVSIVSFTGKCIYFSFDFSICQYFSLLLEKYRTSESLLCLVTHLTR